MKKSLVIFLLITAFCVGISAAERFVIIADAEVPELMKTVQSFGAFSEPIIPGSSMVILGSVIALNFNPQLAPFDMMSGMRFMAYSDTAEAETLPIICGMTKFKSDQPLPKTIKIDKSDLFVRNLDGKAVVSSSEQLLDTLKTIEKPFDNDSDVVINIFPDQYLKNCSANIIFLRGEFDREISEEKIAEYLPDNKVVEKLLAQCSKLQIKAKANKKNLDFTMDVFPVTGSELALFVKNGKAGEVAGNDIISLGKKITGNDSVNVNNSINGLVTLVLLKIFPKGNSEDFSKLCKIDVTNEQTRLQFKTSIKQEALKATLIAAGVIKPKHKSGS